MSATFGLKAGNSPGAGSLLSIIESLPAQTPTPNDVLGFVAAPTSRVVRITALGQGTIGSVVTITDGGTVLATGTVIATGGAGTDATHIDQGASIGLQFAIEVKAWLDLNLVALGSPTTQLEADGSDGGVLLTYDVGSSPNSQDYATDDPALFLAFYVTVTGLGAGIYQMTTPDYNGAPAYNLVNTPPSLDNNALKKGEDPTNWAITDSSGNTVTASLEGENATLPSEATWPSSVVVLRSSGTDAMLRKVSKAEMGVVCVLGSVTVDLNTTALQLSQIVVPTGKVCVVTGEIVRNASVDLTGMTGNLFTGWDATNADDLWVTSPEYNFRPEQLTLLTTSSLATGRNSLYPRDGDGANVTANNAQLLVGTAGQTLGFKCSAAFGSAATVTVDVLGYFV